MTDRATDRATGRGAGHGSELAVALDFGNAADALSMARRLQGTAGWMKIGLELFCAEGPELVHRVKALGFKVFLDLKFFDIPNTVRGAVRSAAAAGADMVNVHALGGARMAEAALEGREQGAALRIEGGPGPLVLGVTVLTSMDAADLGPLAAGPDGLNVGELVLDLARRCKAYYLDGVVCSGLEVETIKAACGHGFRCLTPGIRLAGGADGQAPQDDQRRVVTPAQAVASGADYLVVGRPITAAPDPAAMARLVLEQMGQTRE